MYQHQYVGLPLNSLNQISDISECMRVPTFRLREADSSPEFSVKRDYPHYPDSRKIRQLKTGQNFQKKSRAKKLAKM